MLETSSSSPMMFTENLSITCGGWPGLKGRIWIRNDRESGLRIIGYIILDLQH
jgi:hypothetical protein